MVHYDKFVVSYLMEYKVVYGNINHRCLIIKLVTHIIYQVSGVNFIRLTTI